MNKNIYMSSKNEKNLNLKSFPKAFYVAGFIIIIFGGVFFLLGSSMSLIILLVVSVPVLIIYLNIKPINDKIKKSNTIIIASTVIFTLLIVVFLFLSSQEPSVLIENNNVKITGLYGESIPIDNIEEFSLSESIPSIIFRSNGLGLGKIKKGYFKAEGLGTVKLFLQNSKKPYIHLIDKTGNHYFINMKEPDKTSDTYSFIRKKLNWTMSNLII